MSRDIPATALCVFFLDSLVERALSEGRYYTAYNLFRAARRVRLAFNGIV